MGYNPQKLIIEELDNGSKQISGILFENELIVPVSNEKIPDEMKSIPTVNKKIYYNEFIGFNYHSDYLTSNMSQMMIKDYLYQQFKYDFSYFINEYENIKIKKELVSLIEKPLINIELNRDKFFNLIKDLMKPLVHKLQNIVEINKGLYIGVCYKYNNSKQYNKNVLCNFDNNDRKLR